MDGSFQTRPPRPVIPTSDPSAPPTTLPATERHPLRRLNVYLWRYKRLLLPGLVCAFVSAGFQLVVPTVVREAIDAVPRMVALDRLYGGTEAGAYFGPLFTYTLVWSAVAVLVMSALSGLFTFIMRQTVVVASRHIEYDLRGRLYEHLQRLDQAAFNRYPTGDIITRASSDIERVRRYVGPALMYAVRALTVVILALGVMLWISPVLTFWALLPMPALAVAVFFVSKLVHTRTDRLQKQYSALTSRVQEALAGIRVLKAYAREDAEGERFAAESQTYRERALDLARVDAAFRPVMVLLIGASTALVVLIGGRLVMAGSLTLGNIAEYVIYVAIMTWPVASFGYVVSMIQQASASATRIFEMLDQEPAVQDDARTDAAVTAIEGRITLDDVYYRYGPDEPFVLDRVSLDVPAGTTLGIVGRTGSGKSTLVELIPRLIEASGGQVKIDGRPIEEIPVDVLRQGIGYVPQDVFLFSDTVGHNIAFGRMDADDQAVRRAAEEADLLANVEDFPAGFETMVGERGITLSGGQKQRSALARAMVREPQILLLDDALSAVDTRTEAAILGHLKRQYGRRTLVIVSHRVSAVQDADQIVAFDEGRIVERGTHAELVQHGGFYADLYRKQLLEAELNTVTDDG